MIEAPRITEAEQKQFRDEFITMIEQYNDQDALEAFRNEWDGAVNFKIIDDHTVTVSIAGEEKLPIELKEKVWDMRNRFDKGNYPGT